MPKPDLAILYWFYKEPETTKNHLKLLRKYNPNHKVYGLSGGDPVEAAQYEQALGADLDGFWAYTHRLWRRRFYAMVMLVSVALALLRIA